MCCISFTVQKIHNKNMQDVSYTGQDTVYVIYTAIIAEPPK